MKQFSFLRLKENLFNYIYQKYANNFAGKKITHQKLLEFILNLQLVL